MTVWTIRGGRNGQHEAAFLEKGVVSVGFGLQQSVADFQDRESLRQHCDSQNGAGQLWRFYHDVGVGDMVVLPRKLTGQIAVGRISGPYEFQSAFMGDHAHGRPVEWLVTDVPRSHFDRDLLNSFGAQMTLSQPGAPNAESRVERIVNVYLGSAPVPEPMPIDEGVAGDDDFEEGVDHEQEIKDQIVAQLRRQFAGLPLERLVAGILKASGYVALQTRKGADGGIDILAGKGDLGFDEPRLCVQVKGRAGPVDLVEYDRLRGNIATFRAEHGLLVSLGGFTKPVLDRNEQEFFNIRLWNADDLAERLLASYDSLPPDIKTDIPLKWVRVLLQTD